MRRHSRVGLPAVALAVLLGCTEDLGPRVPAAIAVTPSAPKVPIEGNLQLEPAVVDASGRAIDGHTFTFVSSDTSIVTVDEGGLRNPTGFLGSELPFASRPSIAATVGAIDKLTRHSVLPFFYTSGVNDVFEVEATSGRITRRFRTGPVSHAVSPDGTRLHTLSLTAAGDGWVDFIR